MNDGITKQDFLVALSGLESRLMERFEGRLDTVEQRLNDRIRESDHDLRTTLLTEFQKWGRTFDMRTSQAITDVALLGE